MRVGRIRRLGIHLGFEAIPSDVVKDEWLRLLNSIQSGTAHFLPPGRRPHGPEAGLYLLCHVLATQYLGFRELNGSCAAGLGGGGVG